MKLSIYLTLLLFLSFNALGVTLSPICNPINSPLERTSFNSDVKSQTYHWAAFNKLLPDAALDKFYGATPFGNNAIHAEGFDVSNRWSGLGKAAKDECYFYKKMPKELQGRSSCSPNLFKEKTDGEAEVTLFKNYCQPKMPKSVDEMFGSETDLPAEFVNLWDKSYLTKNYNMSKPSVLEKKDLDTETFFLLNITAEKLWNEILNCEDNDAELARISFSTGKFTCPQGNDIKGEIKNLITNTVNYFSSSNAVHTPFYDYIDNKWVSGTISHDSPILVGMYNAGGGVEKYLEDWSWTGGRRGMEAWDRHYLESFGPKFLSSGYFKKNFDNYSSRVERSFQNFSIQKVLSDRVQIHPLFSELVLEILASQFISGDIVKEYGENNRSRFAIYHWGGNDENVNIANLNNNIADFALTYLERMCEPAGIWPSAGFSALLYLQRKISVGLSLEDNERLNWLQRQPFFPEISIDYQRIGYWSVDFEKAQLNCVRGKTLPEIYYRDRKSILKHYRDMFRRHLLEK